MSEPASAAGSDLRSAMNAHGACLLGVLGQQMNAHLNSLAAFEEASFALAAQCRRVEAEVARLLEALEVSQGAHADAVVQAVGLRSVVAEFAQHVGNAQALGLNKEPRDGLPS